MSRKDKSYLVKADVDIWMMLLFFRHFRDSVHKIDCVSKIVELERALDVLFLQLPLGHFFQTNFCFIGFDQIRHIGRTSNTRNLFCKRRLLPIENQAGGRGRPRILRRFLSESKSSTATARDCRESAGQSAITSFTAALADSKSLTKRKPLGF